MLEREENFFINTLTASKRAVERGAGAIALFDIDETIGSGFFNPDHTVTTILRPSVFPLFDKLKAMGIEIGLLSSRGKDIMIEQLQQENNLAGIKDYVKPDLVFSSNAHPSESSSDFAEEISARFGGENGVLDDDILRGVDEFELPIAVGDQQKIATLQEIRTKFSEKSIISVDDAMFPKFANQSSGVYGVCLADGKGKFFRP